jgi:hypothetical protein
MVKLAEIGIWCSLALGLGWSGLISWRIGRGNKSRALPRSHHRLLAAGNRQNGGRRAEIERLTAIFRKQRRHRFGDVNLKLGKLEVVFALWNAFCC